jgi:hypothetical protein
MYKMKAYRWFVWLMAIFLPYLLMAGVAQAVTVSPATLTLKLGGAAATATISNVTGTLRTPTISSSSVATISTANNVITITPKAVGTAYITVRDTSTRAYLNISVVAADAANKFSLVAWNDLGMHCMDADYSVFSILPPYNNLHAQLIDSTNNKLLNGGAYTVTFEAMADPDGSINSYSVGKTNFWQYAESFFGMSLPNGIGLTGYGTMSDTPQAMKSDTTTGQFVAEGVPLTPYDDTMRRNPYPMTRVVARDANGAVLAEAHVVMPVSDEMTCISCHASSSGPAAKPMLGWVNDSNLDRDYKRNILRLHDEKNLPQWKYKLALKQKGYDKTGLLATSDLGRPILCAGCHSSNALPGTGLAGIKPLTEAIHSHHGNVKDASTGELLGSSTNRETCYQCHPGKETQCLRGAMGKAVEADGSMSMQCQNCHGQMANVGKPGRTGWMDQPNCQSCHHDGLRDKSAVDTAGVLKVWSDKRFATNADTPKTGFSLYRFSKGHGNLQCSACHGSTHAEFPSSHANDNVMAKEMQGHEGTLVECVACHKTTVPITADGGPHGMHTVGATWVSRHTGFAGSTAARAVCATCHGADFRGSVLSQVKVAKTLNNRSFKAGQAVGCYDCHNGPNGGD